MTAKPKEIRKPPLKFIDRLEKELKGAGIRIKRGGMTDWSFDKNGKRSDNADDPCEWIKIILKTEDEKKKYEVEFFFSNNSKKLESVHLYVKKKKKGYGGGKLIGLDRPKEPLKSKVIEPKQKISSASTGKTVFTTGPVA